jgi:hypothetical protein
VISGSRIGAPGVGRRRPPFYLLERRPVRCLAVPGFDVRPTRRRVATSLLVGALGVALAVLVGCSDAPSQPDLVDSLVRSGLSTEEAECAAAALYDNLPDDQIAAITERGPSAVIDDPKDPDEPIDVARSEIAACRSVSTTSTSAAAPDTTLPVDAPTTEGAELNPGRATPWWSAGASSTSR